MPPEQFGHVRPGLFLAVSHGYVALEADARERNEGDAVGMEFGIVGHDGAADAGPYHPYDGPVLLSLTGDPDGDAGLPVYLVGNIPHTGGTGVDDDVFRLQFPDMDGFSAGEAVRGGNGGHQKLFKDRDKFDLWFRRNGSAEYQVEAIVFEAVGQLA